MDPSISGAAPRKKARTLSSNQVTMSRNDPSIALPPETFAYLLGFLAPPALTRCERVSRSWNSVCTDEALWRQLSLRLGYCQSDRAAEETSSGIRVVASVLQQYDASAEETASRDLLQATIQRYRSRNATAYFDDCETWRTLCCRLWRLDCHWSGKDPASVFSPSSTIHGPESDGDGDAEATSEDQINPYLLPQRRVLHEKRCGSGVWRCKVDPEERTYIVTGQKGGIEVFDHATNTLLWHIPRTATRPTPHLEYSRGWMIFDRPGIGHFEVWRRESLVPDLGRAPDRGHYQRFTILSSTRPIRAYRFQFPHLCAASQDGFILIWNVPQQELVETIDFRDSPHRGGNINYIDFDDQFVFLNGLGAKSVSVFSRRTKSLIWTLGQHFASDQPPPTTWRLKHPSTSAYPTSAFVRQQLVRAPPNLWQAGPNSMNWAQRTMTPYQIWSAVHPDLKTKTLLILGQGTVLLIRDYQEFFNDPSKPPELFAEIEFQDLEEYYRERVVGVIEEDLSDLGWNNPRMWETLGDAQLTVHEGKAVIVNDLALILDLNAEPSAMREQDATEQGRTGRQAAEPSEAAQGATPLARSPNPADGVSPQAELPREGDSDADAESRSRRREETALPPIAVYCETNRPENDSYQQCSSLQMDEVGIYVTLDRDAFGETRWSEEYRRMLVHLDFSTRAQLAGDEDGDDAGQVSDSTGDVSDG